MKPGKLIITSALLFTVSLIYAEDKISIGDTYGTWVNADYNERSEVALVIFNPDGSAVGYAKDTDTEISWTAQLTITDSWYDEDGNLWIKREGDLVSGARTYFYYWLEKYSSDGSVWEYVWRGSGYPTEMSLIGGNYEIHYRQD
jgi:hypothetical protein